VWQENYPGSLTELEEAFARALTAHAKRRKRRRRIAVAAAFVVLFAVLAVVGSFWQRSVREARRTQAANLVSLGLLELEDYPTAAVAYALASLEQADSVAARHLALQALWKGPTAFVASDDLRAHHSFTPDGRWLVIDRATASKNLNHLTLVGADGVAHELENVHVGSSLVYFFMGSGSQTFVSVAQTDDSGWKVVLWSVPEKRPLVETKLSGSQALSTVVVNPSKQRAVLLIREDERISVDVLGFDGRYERLGTLDFEVKQDDTGRRTTGASLDPRAGEWLGVFHENEVYVVDVGDHELGPPRLLGRHEGRVAYAACDPLGRFLLTAGEDGEIRLWSLDSDSPPEVFQGPPGQVGAGFSSDGSLFDVTFEQEDTLFSWVWRLGVDPPRLLRSFNLGPSFSKRFNFGRSPGRSTWDALRLQVARVGLDSTVRIWAVDALADAEPLTLLRGDVLQVNAVSFAPEGNWLATADMTGLAMWPLAERYPVVIGQHGRKVYGLAFAPDGEWLASSSADGTVRLWPLDGDPPPSGRILQESRPPRTGLAVSPDGKSLLVGTGKGSWLLPVEGDAPWKLVGFDGQTWQGAFSPDGRLAAEIGGSFRPAERLIRVWETSSWSEAAELEFGVGEEPCGNSLQFTQDGRLLATSQAELQRWNLDTGERELLYEGAIHGFAASADGRRVAVSVAAIHGGQFGSVVLLDLDSNTETPLDAFGDEVVSVAIDPEGTFVVTGSLGGEVRAGPLTGENPHLFLGHESAVNRVTIDPRGRWIASAGDDTTVRLWPMPDLSKPPLHTLPHKELIAKLKSLTNLRVVRDDDSPTGWKLEVGPFPGWETVPTW
jgi:WD40 repeat protein